MSSRSTPDIQHSSSDVFHRLFFDLLPIFVLREIKVAAVLAQRKQAIVSFDDFLPGFTSLEVTPNLLPIRVHKLLLAFYQRHLTTQLHFGCDVSKAGPLVSQNDLAEDLLGFISSIVVKKPVAQSVTD